MVGRVLATRAGGGAGPADSIFNPDQYRVVMEGPTSSTSKSPRDPPPSQVATTTSTCRCPRSAADQAPRRSTAGQFAATACPLANGRTGIRPRAAKAHHAGPRPRQVDVDQLRATPAQGHTRTRCLAQILPGAAGVYIVSAASSPEELCAACLILLFPAAPGRVRRAARAESSTTQAET